MGDMLQHDQLETLNQTLNKIRGDLNVISNCVLIALTCIGCVAVLGVILWLSRMWV